MANGYSPKTQVDLKIVRQKFIECHKVVELLVDTGSMLSCINVEALNDDAKVFTLKKPISVSGVGEGKVVFKYETELTLGNDRKHKFLVATEDSNLTIKFDGIVGSEFMKRFDVIIDYKNETFTMGNSVLKMDVKQQKNIDFSTNAVNNLDDEHISLVEHNVTLSSDESELPDKENEIKS